MDTRRSFLLRWTVRRCFKRRQLFDQFYGLAEVLLWRNHAFMELTDPSMGPYEGPFESQVAFATIAGLDLQVSNGGLLQYFWNCPGWVDYASDALRAIDLPALADCFDNSLAEMVSRIPEYRKFQERGSLQAFSDCAREFSFNEFDSAYYKHKDQVYANTVAFVARNLSEFIA